MTNPTPHGQVPAIQRYSIGYHSDEWGVRSLSPTGIYDDAGPWVRYEDHAAELCRLHAYCQELESQVIRDCMTHVQKPAEIEHVAGDVSKNGAEVNMNVYAELPQSVGDHKYGGGLYTDAQMLAFADATHALRAQQPAPAPMSPTNRLVAYSAATRLRELGFEWDATAEAWLQQAPATQQAREMPESIEQLAVARYKVVPAHESMFHRFAVVAGDGKQQLYLGREIECQNMARKFAGAFLDGAFVALQNTAPQPSTTAQAAESVTAAATESYVQPVPDKCDRIVWRGHYYHLPPAQAAESVLEDVAAFEVADAMADSQYLAGVSAGWNAANAGDPNAALQKLHASRAGYLKPLATARAPADSVLEDAARLDWLDQQREAYGFQDIHEGNRWEISGAYANVREAIDAARKQGANHD